MKNKLLFIVICIGLLTDSVSIDAQQTRNDSSQIQNLNLQKFKSLEDQLRLSDSLNNKKLKELEASITSQNFTRILKSVNIAKFKNDVSFLKARYIAGEEILDHIIRETNSFNFSYQQLVLQSEFSELTNPTNYSDFSTPLTATLNSLKDKKPFPDVTQDISSLSKDIPYLNNPIVSSGLSITSYFIAKFNDKKKFDSENFKKMTCVLNFTSTTYIDYQNSIQQIIYLRDKIQTFNNTTRDFFSKYLNTIGYTSGYIAYKQMKVSTGTDFLESTRRDFFNTILADTTIIGIVAISTDKDDNVLYYIDQVKFYIAEYESILRDIDNSITSYKVFYTKLQTNVNNSCTGIQTFVLPKLTTINTNIANVEEAFKKIKDENQLPADLKRKLLGL